MSDPVGTQKTALVEVNGVEYTALMTVVENGINVECPDLPGVVAQANTYAEARVAIKAAIEAHLAG